MTTSAHYKSIDERRKLIVATVTLNGKPAKISGVYNDVATVWLIESPAVSADFGWSTVGRIVAHGGDFYA